jgi:hypothetical protein
MASKLGVKKLKSGGDNEYGGASQYFQAFQANIMQWMLLTFLFILCASLFYKLTHKKKPMTSEEIEEEARKWRAIIYARKFGIVQDDLRNIHLR